MYCDFSDPIMRGSVSYLMFVVGWNLLLQAVSQLDLLEPIDSTDWQEDCPQILPKIFTGYIPRGNESAGVYVKKPEATTIKSCAALCCEQQSCNVVFMFKQVCLQVLLQLHYYI